MQKTFNISIRFPHNPKISQKAAHVMRMFGVTTTDLSNPKRTHLCTNLKISQGDIVFITGSSGSGKSVIFNQLYDLYDHTSKIRLDKIKLPKNSLVIDNIKGHFLDSLKTLSASGISDVFDILNIPKKLSDGQKYRYKLAVAASRGKKTIFADEFCSNLDRLTACSLSQKLAKFARKNNITLILASAHEDIIPHINPDTLIIKYHTNQAEIIHKTKRT